MSFKTDSWVQNNTMSFMNIASYKQIHTTEVNVAYILYGYI